jgi:dihydrofolate reductase
LDGVFDASAFGQWFAPFDSDERQAHIRAGILASDGMLFGRTTYEMLAPYWSAMKNDEMGIAAKINSVPKYVVSTTLKNAEWNNTTIIGDDAANAIAKLKSLPGREIQIFGSSALVRSLMDTNLIDEYQFLVQPIVAGQGQRFFEDGMQTGGMKLVEAKPLPSGVIALTYQRASN